MFQYIMIPNAVVYYLVVNFHCSGITYLTYTEGVRCIHFVDDIVDFTSFKHNIVSLDRVFPAGVIVYKNIRNRPIQESFLK